MDLYHLVYISKSLIDGTQQVIEWELESILSAALRYNSDAGVTGALLYSGGYFCQILEGPNEVVRHLFEKIRVDDRHGEVNTLVFEPVAERQFGQWAMAFAGMNQQPLPIEGIQQREHDIDAKAIGRQMIERLVEMVDERERAGPVAGPRGQRLLA